MDRKKVMKNQQSPGSICPPFRQKYLAAIAVNLPAFPFANNVNKQRLRPEKAAIKARRPT
jgi:hypothetical protein